MVDSQRWPNASNGSTAKASPAASGAIAFQLDGDAIPASRTVLRKSWISSAEGIAQRPQQEDSSTLWIAGDEPLALRHQVPSVFDLGLLAGRRVRVTLLHVSTPDAELAQTLSITGCDGGLLVLAHAGPVRGAAHALGRLHVYAALSQRPGGPMVFGTARMQSIVRAGDHLRVRDGDDAYVMHFASRRGDVAAYAIGAEELWRGPPSTLR